MIVGSDKMKQSIGCNLKFVVCVACLGEYNAESSFTNVFLMLQGES